MPLCVSWKCGGEQTSHRMGSVCPALLWMPASCPGFPPGTSSCCWGLEGESLGCPCPPAWPMLWVSDNLGLQAPLTPICLAVTSSLHSCFLPVGYQFPLLRTSGSRTHSLPGPATTGSESQRAHELPDILCWLQDSVKWVALLWPVGDKTSVPSSCFFLPKIPSNSVPSRSCQATDGVWAVCILTLQETHFLPCTQHQGTGPHWNLHQSLRSCVWPKLPFPVHNLKESVRTGWDGDKVWMRWGRCYTHRGGSACSGSVSWALTYVRHHWRQNRRAAIATYTKWGWQEPLTQSGATQDEGGPSRGRKVGAGWPGQAPHTLHPSTCCKEVEGCSSRRGRDNWVERCPWTKTPQIDLKGLR